VIGFRLNWYIIKPTWHVTSNAFLPLATKCTAPTFSRSHLK
jgi:hypothetical protein